MASNLEYLGEHKRNKRGTNKGGNRVTNNLSLLAFMAIDSKALLVV